MTAETMLALTLALTSPSPAPPAVVSPTPSLTIAQRIASWEGHPAAKLTTAKTVVETRAPIGHVHVCVNGHPFDHASTSGHNCPICGATPPTDRYGRYLTAPWQMIPVTRQVQIEQPLIRAAQIGRAHV